MPAEDKRFRDRWFLTLAGVLLLAVTAAGGYLWRQLKPPRQQPPKQEMVELPSGTGVSFTGPVMALNAVPVPIPVDGTVDSVEVEEGTEVFQGQLLIRIRNEGLDAAREAAQQELEQMQGRVQNLESGVISARLEASRAAAEAARSQGDFDRIERIATRQQMLYREGATPRLVFEKSLKDLELARSERDSLREVARQARERVTFLQRELEFAKKSADEKSQSLEGAKADLQTAEITSPVDGLLVTMRAKPGDQVQASNQDLIVVAVEPSEMQVRIQPDPKVLPKLRDGLPALVQILELSSDGIPGELRREEDGEWHVEFTAADPNIKPGLNALVKVKLP